MLHLDINFMKKKKKKKKSWYKKFKMTIIVVYDKFRKFMTIYVEMECFFSYNYDILFDYNFQFSFNFWMMANQFLCNITNWQSTITVCHNWNFFKLTQLLSIYEQRSNHKLEYQIKEKKILRNFQYLVFLRIFGGGGQKCMKFTTSKGSLTTIIKKYNYFLCVPKAFKLHENL